MSSFEISTAPLTEDEAIALHDRSGEFVLASTNVDEDLHFSTLYLESTLSPPDPRWGVSTWYTELVAFNRQAIERYYLPVAECQAVSSELTDAVLDEPRVLTSLLHEIERRAGLLDTAFPFGWLESTRRDYSRAELIELYRRHLALHQYLYEVARVPEALDRGTGTFSRRLREMIESRVAVRGASEDALAVVSAIGKPSIFREEQLTFVELCRSLSSHEQRAVAGARSGALALMALTPESRSRLGEHRDRWAPLFYHGYGSREPVALTELAARIRQVLRKGESTVLPEVPSEADRVAMVELLGLSAKEEACVFGYGLLGWTKARRRWFQLRNFQRLDLLIELLAVELDCAEWDLRVLLPSEVLDWLETGRRPAEAIAAREDGTVLWYRRHELRVAEIAERFAFDAAVDRLAPMDCFEGEGIVSGKITGRCVIGSRGGNPPLDEETSHPLVLVVPQLDSDLVWMLPFYDGLVVEEHGASAHASIIAREIGIPAVAGVANATRSLVPGDTIAVDGDTGQVVRVEPGP